MAFDNLKAVCEIAGCTFHDIVDLTTFHTDPESQIETVVQVSERLFQEPNHPNWTVVGVDWLAGFNFEVKAIANIPPVDQVE